MFSVLLSLFLVYFPVQAQPAAPSVAASTSQVQSEALASLCRDYWEAEMRKNPTYATFLADNRYNDKLEDIGPKGRERDLKDIREFQARLSAIDLESLSGPDKVTWDTLKLKLEFSKEWYGHKFYQWGVDQMDGPQSWFAQLMNFTPLKTKKDAKDLLSRFNAYPGYLGQYISNLKEGLAEGRTAARVPTLRVIEQIDGMLAVPPEGSPFGQKAANLPQELRSPYEAKLMKAVQKSVYPALEGLSRFLKEEYLPHTREKEVGVWAIEGGTQAYRFMIRYHTTLEWTAEELHRIGLQELKEIHDEMADIAKRMGHEGSLVAFFDKVKSDPKNFFSTREEVQESAKKLMSRIYEKLPRYFGALPAIACEIKPIEEYREKDAAAAFYYPPPEDGSRPGIYYINTYEPSSRARYEMAPLAAHEAVPGHHLQIALAVEAKGLPQFRRHSHFTAFTEGWALYTERLADEMGIYEDDITRFGMLTNQALRASRLVVDTGMHALHWTRQQAIDFMKENALMPELEVVTEVDRYIIWPGQALAYKVGQRELQALRKEAEEKLGLKFDIRKFHDVVLKNGSVPLPTLRQIVREWIASESGS